MCPLHKCIQKQKVYSFFSPLRRHINIYKIIFRVYNLTSLPGSSKLVKLRVNCFFQMMLVLSTQLD